MEHISGLMKQIPSIRSIQQNKAMHKYFQIIADELNQHGLYIQDIIKTEAPWDAHRVKELIWRPTQRTLFNKKSTTQLTTKEVKETEEVIGRALAHKGMNISFPSIEQLYE